MANETLDKNQYANMLSNELLLDYASKVVLHYVNKGSISNSDKDDVKMSIVEKFLAKKDKILAAFQGKSTITTYCYAVLNRMCCEIIRKDIRENNKHQNSDYEQIYPLYNSISKNIFIEDEIKILEKIFLSFNDEKSKVILFLKFIYDIPILETDVQNYFGKMDSQLKGILLNNKGDLPASEKYIILQEIVNFCEGKHISSDAVRMWHKKVITRIIERLNGTIQRSNFNKESLGILMEYMYCQKDGSELNTKVFNTSKVKIKMI